jgi:hypothetical protein
LIAAVFFQPKSGITRHTPEIINKQALKGHSRYLYSNYP